MPWQPCVNFSEAMGGGIAEGHPYEIVFVGRRRIGLRMPHNNAAPERTFPMANNIGKVLSVILPHWLNVS